MSDNAEGELQCDAMLRAMDPDESMRIALLVGDAIRTQGKQGRANIISGLVTVLLTACDPAKIEAQSEGAIELIRRSVRKELAEAKPK